MRPLLSWLALLAASFLLLKFGTYIHPFTFFTSLQFQGGWKCLEACHAHALSLLGCLWARHDEDLREPLVRRQGSQVSMRVARGQEGAPVAKAAQGHGRLTAGEWDEPLLHHQRGHGAAALEHGYHLVVGAVPAKQRWPRRAGPA